MSSADEDIHYKQGTLSSFGMGVWGCGGFNYSKTLLNESLLLLIYQLKWLVAYYR